VLERTAFLDDGCLMLNGFCCQRGIEREEEGEEWRSVDAIRESSKKKGMFQKPCACV